LAAVLALLAGGLPVILGGTGTGPRPGLAVQAPGSDGSVHSYHWWDPRGWFGGGGSGTPGTRVLDDNAAAVPSTGRMPRQAALGPVHRVRELTGKRDEYTRTYQLSDGKLQAVISSGPVNYRDGSGKWQPISTTVQPSALPGYRYQNVSNTFQSFFGSTASQLVRFNAPGGGWLSIGLAGGRVRQPLASGDTITYRDIAPGVSVSYEVTPESLKERITLASAAAAASLGSLPFVIKAGGGLTPYLQHDGSIALTRDGVPVLTLPKPFMTDARRQASSPFGFAWSPKVAQHVTWDAASNTMRLTVSADSGWLGQAARRFPVVVDPTISISPTPADAQNTMIISDSGSSTTNYSSSWRLSAGTDSGGAVRSLLSFPLGAVPAGTQLSSADLELYYDQTFGPGTANQTIEAHQATAAWSASTATWANANNNVGQLGNNQVVVDDSDTAHTSASGAWPSAATSSAVNGEYVYNQDTTSGDTFTWVPPLTESGSYQVEAHYVASSTAASNAPYTVYYNGGSHQYTVNQQSGSGGVWTTLGTQSFAAGNTGKIVLGDGPATASTRVEADAVRLTKSASLTVNPNVDNIWNVFSVRNIVQSWLSGTSPNYGFVLKAANESALNVGGPRYEASRTAYNGETVTYPQLVLTYGTPGVTLNPITTIHATGADLSWTAYADPTPGTNPGDDLAEYQVHRSVFQSFTPAANTLVAPVPAGTTSFTDTTNTPTPPGGLGNAFYYMLAVKTKDGTIIPGPVQLVRLPTAGSTIQIVNASEATTLSSAQPTTNEQHITGQPWTSVGDDSATFGTTRSVFAFPSMASAGIPADATVSDAHLKLWGFYNDTAAGATYEAHALTQSFDPATATWNSASSGTAWTTAGGSFGSVLNSINALTNDPDRQNWTVTSAAQDWIVNPGDEHGLLVKLSGESSKSPQERELFLDTTAPEPALRPELVVTYTEPTAADTYYAPSLPTPMASATSYTVPVTLANTTSSTWSSSDWVLSYHWLLPDGTDVSTSSDQVQTALPASMAPSSVTTVNAAVKTPDTTGSGGDRTGYQLAWDLYDKTTGTWLSSGTSTPSLSAAGARLLGAARGASAAGADAAALPMAPGNNSVPVLKQAASVEQPSSNLLGLEKFYQYTGINTGAGSAILNNAYAGNTVWNYNAFSNPSRGFRTFVRLTYNSMDTSESSMGFGWSLQASTLMRLGTPLDFLPNPHPTTIKLTDGDGTSHLFTYNSSTGQWQSPPGVHYYLQSEADCSANGKDPIAKAWLLTAPDRTQFWFDCQGYQTAVVDKNGNEADFTYTQRNSNNQPVKFLDYITDPSGRQTLSISYYAKGDSYSYIDANGNVASGTNLTNPDIIDQVKSITDISGRTITFLYNVQGLMAQMTDGDGTSVAKVFKFGYDMTQGNKNVKLVSVTDPRGNTTNLTYYTAPADPKFKWSLQSVKDRMQRTTSFAYTEQGSGQIQTVVTDPKSNTSTYLLDATGRPVQVTNAKNQVTKLAWDADNNVTSLTEDNGAQTTWTYDPNTGYPTAKKDAQANHDGTAGTTYTYQTALNGHTADLVSELTPQQRLWTFGYDTNGNLTSVTKPLGNVSGATAGSYTTKYAYDSFGELLTSTDPNGNTTGYSSYDPNGYPQAITDPRCYNQPPATCPPTAYVYDVRGNVTSVTDPLQHTTTQAYDVFGRPGQRVVPKTSTVSITTPAPVYDGNDNIVTAYAPNGAATNNTYNADDELVTKVTPADTSTSPAPTTTYTYDANGNMASQTAPDGNVPGAAAGSYTTNFGYDAINEQTSATDALGNVTSFGYDDVGNKISATDPNNNKTQFAFDLSHRLIQTTDAAGNTAKTAYDLDGNVVSTTDQNGNTRLYTLDADAQVTQVQVPAQAPGAPVSYDTTQFAYDQDGNQTKVISPRGVASGISGAYTTQTQYNADNQVSAVLTPYNPNDPVYNTPSQTDYTYDLDHRATSVSAPPSGSQTIRNITNYQYFYNGWAQSSTDPLGITTSYDYNALGEQSSRTIVSAGGAMSRTISWGYYPDGKMASVTDNGVPTGLFAEVVESTDSAATASPTASWPMTTCGPTDTCQGYQYRTHAAGTGNDTFTWRLSVPADGNYTVYVKYPLVTGAATNAAFTVNYSGGSATVNVDQTKNNNGSWVALGKWAFTKAGTNQQVSLAENSGGTVVADSVQIVRDNSGDTNTATQTYGYTYDANGNKTGITDSATPTPAVTSYAMAYDQLDRNTSVTEKDSSGNTVHTTAYGYDAASNLTSRTHDGAPSTYTYNNLNEQVKESDAKSSTDTSPQVTTFTYTPAGQVATQVKPNGNTVTSAYYANEQLQNQTENTSGGTLVSSHAYSYDPNGNKTQDTQKLMSADASTSYLSHTLAYAYDPLDRIQQVTTDGTVTEAYAHDADNNVTSQTIGTVTTNYSYVLNRLQSASVSTGGSVSYNYDPFGRLDSASSIAADGTVTPLETNTYDGFDNLVSHGQYNPSTHAMDSTSYTYDPLGRRTSQTTSAGTTTSYAYLGLSADLVSETGPAGQPSKTYDYTPAGLRLSQTTTPSGGTSTTGYYSYNDHADVEAVTNSSGTTTSTYGYTAYGDSVQGMFTGKDKNTATPGPAVQPDNPYRFNAMRWDSSSGQYDMGFRNYDPNANQFLSRDMYGGALADMGLDSDPFTGSRYAFGDGNPISNIELDGHMFVGGGGSGCILCNSPLTTMTGPTTGTPTGPMLTCMLISLTCASTGGILQPPLISRNASGGVALPRGGLGGIDWGELGKAAGIFAAVAAAGAAIGALARSIADRVARSQGCFGQSGNATQITYFNLSTAGGAAPAGRATGVEACLSPQALNINRVNGVIVRGNMPDIPGMQDGFDRSHLLAREFGGNNSPENLVPLYWQANQQNGPNQMGEVEDRIRAALQSKQRVYFLAVPQYNGLDPYVPTSIQITLGTAVTGLRNFTVINQQ
jgi:RHS repeat-associated protein